MADLIPLDEVLNDPRFQEGDADTRLDAIRKWENYVLDQKNSTGEWNLEDKLRHDIRVKQARQQALGIEPMAPEEILSQMAEEEKEDNLAPIFAALEEVRAAEREKREINNLKFRTLGDDEDYLSAELQAADDRIYLATKGANKQAGRTGVVEEARRADEALQGKRDYGVVQGKLFVNPKLYYDREKFLEVVNNSEARNEEKARVLAGFTRVREDLAKEHIGSFKGLTSFRGFAKEYAATNPEATNGDVIEAFQKSNRGDWEKGFEAFGSGLLSGAEGAGYLGILAGQGLKKVGADRLGGIVEDTSMGFLGETSAAKQSASARIELLGGLEGAGKLIDPAANAFVQIATTMLSGGTVTVAKQVAAQAAKKGVKKQVSAQLAKSLLAKSPTKKLATGEYLDLLQKPMAIALAGASSAGPAFYENYERHRSELAAQGLAGEELEAEARQRGLLDATRTGVITAAITSVFGLRGIEGIARLNTVANNPAARKTLSDQIKKYAAKEFKTELSDGAANTLAFAGRVTAGGLSEGLEEALDEGINGGLDALISNPDMTWEDWWKNTLFAGTAGAVIGGAVELPTNAFESFAARTNEAILRSPEMDARRRKVEELREAGLTQTADALEKANVREVEVAGNRVFDAAEARVTSLIDELDQIEQQIDQAEPNTDTTKLKARRDEISNLLNATVTPGAEYDPVATGNRAVAELVAEGMDATEARTKVVSTINDRYKNTPVSFEQVIEEAREREVTTEIVDGVETPSSGTATDVPAAGGVTPVTPTKAEPTFRAVEGRPVRVEGETGTLVIEEDGTVLLDRGPTAPPIIVGKNPDQKFSESEFSVSLDESAEQDDAQAAQIISEVGGRKLATPVSSRTRTPRTAFVRKDGAVVTNRFASTPGGKRSTVSGFVASDFTGDTPSMTLKDRETGKEFTIEGDDAITVGLELRARQGAEIAIEYPRFEEVQDIPEVRAEVREGIDRFNQQQEYTAEQYERDARIFEQSLTRHLINKPNLLKLTTDEDVEATPEELGAAVDELNNLREQIYNETKNPNVRQRVEELLDEVLADLSRVERRSSQTASQRKAETATPSGSSPTQSRPRLPSVAPEGTGSPESSAGQTQESVVSDSETNPPAPSRFQDFKSNSSALAAIIRESKDGFTVGPDGSFATIGYLVAPSKATGAFVNEDFSDADLEAYLEQHADMFDIPGAQLGGWFDIDTNRFVLDVSFPIINFDTAVEISIAADQDALFDVSTFTTVNTKSNRGNPNNAKEPILPFGFDTTVESIKQKFPDPSVLPQLASQESWGVKQELGEESSRILADGSTSPASPRFFRDWLKSNSGSDNPRPTEVVESLRRTNEEAGGGVESPLRRSSEAQRGGLKILPGLPAGMDPDKPDYTSGEEHEVWNDYSTGRVWKVLRRPDYGKSRNLRKYLVRLEAQNVMWGDDIRVEGLLPDGRMVTSQPFVEGRHPESPLELRNLLEKQGWSEWNRSGTVWQTPDGVILMEEVTPQNFIVNEKGEAVAIDVLFLTKEEATADSEEDFEPETIEDLLDRNELASFEAPETEAEVTPEPDTVQEPEAQEYSFGLTGATNARFRQTEDRSEITLTGSVTNVSSDLRDALKDRYVDPDGERPARVAVNKLKDGNLRATVTFAKRPARVMELQRGEGPSGVSFYTSGLDAIEIHSVTNPAPEVTPETAPEPFKSINDFLTGVTFGELMDERNRQKAMMSGTQRMAFDKVLRLLEDTKNSRGRQVRSATFLPIDETDPQENAARMLALVSAERLGIVSNVSSTGKTFRFTGNTTGVTTLLPVDVFPEIANRNTTPLDASPTSNPTARTVAEVREEMFNTDSVQESEAYLEDKKPLTLVRVRDDGDFETSSIPGTNLFKTPDGDIVWATYEDGQWDYGSVYSSVTDNFDEDSIRNKDALERIAGEMRDARQQAVSDRIDMLLDYNERTNSEVWIVTQEDGDTTRSMTAKEEYLFIEATDTFLRTRGNLHSARGKNTPLNASPTGDSPQQTQYTRGGEWSEVTNALLERARIRYPNVPTRLDRTVPVPARTVGRQLIFNPDMLSEMTEGMYPQDAAHAIEKIFIHETVHLGATQELGDAEVIAHANQMSLDERLDVARNYLHRSAYPSDRDYQQALIDFTGNDPRLTPAQRQTRLYRLGHEALRMTYERLRTGHTTEETLGFLSMNPGVFRRATFYLRSVLRRLREWVRVRRDPALHSFMDRVSKALWVMENRKLHIDRGEIPFNPSEGAPTPTTVYNALLGREIETGQTRSVPLDASPWGRQQRVPLYNSGKTKGYNQGGWFSAAFRWDRRLFEQLEKSRGRVNASMKRAEFFHAEVRSLMKKHFGPEDKWPTALVNEALGNTDNRLTLADEDFSRQIRKSGLAQAKSDYLKARQRAKSLDTRATTTGNRSLADQAAKLRETAKEQFDLDVKAYKLRAENYEKQARARIRQQARVRQDDILNNQLPKDLVDVLRDMRQQIDLLSKELQRDGLISGDLKATIHENEGLWLHRSYKIFDQDNYVDWLLSEDAEASTIRNKSLNFIRAELIAEEQAKLIASGAATGPAALAQAQAAVTDDMVREKFHDYLSVADFGVKNILQGATVSKEVNTLMQRGTIPPEIRELWGEYDDPIINAAKSLGAVTQFLATQKFFQEIRDLGVKEGWVSENSQYDGQGNRLVPLLTNNGMTGRFNNTPDVRFTPLSGLYGPPALRDALAQTMSDQSRPAWLKFFQSLTGYSMATKTVLSWQSAWRNFWGNIIPTVANGNLGWRSPWQIKTAIVDDFVNLSNRGPKAIRERIIRLVELNVIGESVTESLISELTQGFSSKKKAVTFVEKMMEKTLLSRLVGKGFESATRFYGSQDDFWKIVNFENELKRVEKFRPNATRSEIEEEAAKIVRATMPTYSQAPELVRAIRLMPFLAPYITFPAEVYRTSAGILRTGLSHVAEGLKTNNGALVAAGVSRLTGFALATAGLYGIVALARAQSGWDEEDEEDLRQQLPYWETNSTFVMMGREANGDIDYFNLSYMNPYDVWARPVRAFIRGMKDPDSGVPETITETLSELIDPVAKEQIFFGALIDIARGVEKSGGNVYDTTDPLLRKAKLSLQHIYESALEPGSLASIRRIMKGWNEEVSQAGRSYNFANEFVSAAFGIKKSSTNSESNLSWGARAFKYDQRQAASEFTRVFKSPGTQSNDEIISSYVRANDKMKDAYLRIRRKAVAAIRLGTMTKGDVVRELQSSKLGDDAIADILSNQYRRYMPTKETYTIATQNGRELNQDRIALFREALQLVPPVQQLSEDDNF